LNNALNVVIFVSLKLKEEMNHLPFEDASIDDNDFGSNKIDEGSNFDIFEIMANTNKLAKELVIKNY
jgi:hypothetical protein